MTGIPARIDKQTTAARIVNASILLAVSLSFLSFVFQSSREAFWKAGMGDWMDPYFINALLEHWYRSVWNLTDPSSPPMYFPARQTLGYSHGLVLYAPFYIALRPFLHPFQAYNLTLFAVLETGIVCLYLLFRRVFRLSFLESLVLSAFFFTSQNVVNGTTGVWSQRASVFLIPPILLILFLSRRMPDRRARFILAWLSGLLASLLYTQDFYTAQFALFFLVFLTAPVLLTRRRQVTEKILRCWKEERRGAKVALVTAALAVAWACYLFMFGGGAVQLFGLRIRSNDWRRPALVALAALIVFAGLHIVHHARAGFRVVRPWLMSLALGVVTGSAVFLWIYLGAYREHPRFPDEHLMNALVTRDPSRWNSLLDFVRDLGAYDTLRSFKLVAALAILAWVPWFKVDRTTRIHCLWFLLVSITVLVIPLRFNDFSIWKTFFEHIPGFGVIRDPKRVIYLYELAVVLMVALLLTRIPGKSVYRISITLLLLFFLVTDRSRQVFEYSRPIDVYARWVGAPIDIDGSCKSFFIKRAPQEYTSRSRDMWTLYSIDSIFVSLNHSIPTLNGYSAWGPDGWDLVNPEEDVYTGRVTRWIERHGLTGVCELDVAARTMTPYSLARPQE